MLSEHVENALLYFTKVNSHQLLVKAELRTVEGGKSVGIIECNRIV